LIQIDDVFKRRYDEAYKIYEEEFEEEMRERNAVARHQEELKKKEI